MKFTFTAATALLLVTSSALATEQGYGHHPSSVPTANNSNTNNINYPQQVPNIVGPVPRNSVPVLSIYGQLDYEQKGVYGAQISLPLQFR